MNISSYGGIAFASRTPLNRPRFGVELDPDTGNLINIQKEISDELQRHYDIRPHIKVVRSQKDPKLIRILVKGTDPDDFRQILTKIKLRLFPSHKKLEPACFTPVPYTDELRYDHHGSFGYPRARVKIVAVEDLDKDPESDMP